ncbi:Cyanase [Vibrio nigripulchritudo ATCC 27043]|uniref:hypothetical protein n=1 Tax=Vibrio nigripulchritudo TaxID=28173 RepID=UPI00021C2D46|nr:hypothetical protein [Vibrio nigripulchritudo]EGU61525.1 Cyanase [Vibrio nigripulchritudo ATCC 27043]
MKNKEKLVELAKKCQELKQDIPGAPLYHMGMVAKFGDTESLELLQNTIDYLTCKGKIGQSFNEDEKEFMVELFEAMSWGGKYLGYPEASTLANHYVNGNGHKISLPSEVYTKSRVVMDVCEGMKNYIRSLQEDKKPISSLKSTNSKFLSSQYSKDLFRGKRNVNSHGYLLPSGALLTEQSNMRLKNADHRFILQAQNSFSNKTFLTIWRVESLYDFEPFEKGYVTHLPLKKGMILKIPDGLSHYLTKINVAKSFSHYSEWRETWK